MSVATLEVLRNYRPTIEDLLAIQEFFEDEKRAAAQHEVDIIHVETDLSQTVSGRREAVSRRMNLDWSKDDSSVVSSLNAYLGVA